MKTKLATFALAGMLGTGGVLALAPAVSYAATGDSGAIGKALRTSASGTTADGTQTRQRPASRQNGPARDGRPTGGRLDLRVAAETLGMTQEELRTALKGGATLGAVADDRGVARTEVVDALVAAEKARLAQGVADGRLTQAEADARSADLPARITEALDKPCPPGGRGKHPQPKGSPKPAPSAASS